MQKCAYYAMQCSEQQQRLGQEASRATRRQRRARNKSQVWRRTDSGSLMLFGESSPSSVIRSKLFAKSVFTTSMPILWATYYRWSTLLFVGMTTPPEERRSGKKEDRGVRRAIIFWVCSAGFHQHRWRFHEIQIHLYSMANFDQHHMNLQIQTKTRSYSGGYFSWTQCSFFELPFVMIINLEAEVLLVPK